MPKLYLLCSSPLPLEVLHDPNKGSSHSKQTSEAKNPYRTLYPLNKTKNKKKLQTGYTHPALLLMFTEYTHTKSRGLRESKGLHNYNKSLAGVGES